MIGFLKKFFAPQNATLADPSQWLRDLFAGARSSAGVNVTPSSVLNLSVVFGCVSIISRSFATLPGHLYREVEAGKEKVRNHPLVDLLRTSPNPEMTAVDFFKAMQANASLHGNAYAQVTSNQRGEVTGLWPIPPGKVRLKRQEDKSLVYELSSGESLAFEDVLHLKSTTLDGLVGCDPTLAVRDVFGLAQALDMNAAKFFANGSRPGSVLEYPGRLKPEGRENLRQSIEDAHGGAENAFKLLILEEGLKYAQARMSNNDSQFDETRGRQAVEICRIFGVPPHKVQILDKATYSNIEEQQIDWVQDVLLPICVSWEKAIGCWLLTRMERDAGLYWKFDLRGIMRGRMAERATYYQKAITAGWMNRNEARALEEMNPAPGLDVFLEPMNMSPAGQPRDDDDPPSPPANRLNGLALNGN